MQKSPSEGSGLDLIRYPRYKELHRAIGDCQRESSEASEPHCMSLEGVTGAGKSTLVRDYAAAFPRAHDDKGWISPVVYVVVPSPATIKTTGSAMLQELGDLTPFRGTTGSINNRIINLMMGRVQLLILDEFHHLIDAKTQHVLVKVSEWLKYVIKEAGTSFLVVGIEGAVEKVLDSNPQLSRLFAVRETLRPFRWDDEGQIEFSRFVQKVEVVTGVPLPAGTSRGELMRRIFYATDGVIAHVMNLMRDAATRARSKGMRELDLAVLFLAFEHALARYLKEKANPFGPCIELPT